MVRYNFIENELSKTFGIFTNVLNLTAAVEINICYDDLFLFIMES
jgi:hypothetical protein